MFLYAFMRTEDGVSFCMILLPVQNAYCILHIVFCTDFLCRISYGATVILLHFINSSYKEERL